MKLCILVTRLSVHNIRVYGLLHKMIYFVFTSAFGTDDAIIHRYMLYEEVEVDIIVRRTVVKQRPRNKQLCNRHF